MSDALNIGNQSINNEESNLNSLPEADTLRKSILVVEDEFAIRTLMWATFSPYYEVLLAEDGIDAKGVYLHHSERIVAIITDILMPRMSGVELIRWLDEQGARIPIIIVSGYTGEEDMSPLVSYRGDIVFERKPITISEIRDTLKRLLERKSSTQD